MFLTPKEKGLSQSEIDEIVEQLWKKEKVSNCPDCGVKPGQTHGSCCDISHCLNCGDQTIFEDCCDNVQHDKWLGLWPGIIECYDQKLICYDTCEYPTSKEEIGWCFDLNEYARRK